MGILYVVINAREIAEVKGKGGGGGGGGVGGGGGGGDARDRCVGKSAEERMTTISAAA